MLYFSQFHMPFKNRKFTIYMLTKLILSFGSCLAIFIHYPSKSDLISGKVRSSMETIISPASYAVDFVKTEEVNTGKTKLENDKIRNTGTSPGNSNITNPLASTETEELAQLEQKSQEKAVKPTFQKSSTPKLTVDEKGMPSNLISKKLFNFLEPSTPSEHGDKNPFSQLNENNEKKLVNKSQEDTKVVSENNSVSGNYSRRDVTVLKTPPKEDNDKYPPVIEPYEDNGSSDLKISLPEFTSKEPSKFPEVIHSFLKDKGSNPNHPVSLKYKKHAYDESSAEDPRKEVNDRSRSSNDANRAVALSEEKIKEKQVESPKIEPKNETPPNDQFGNKLSESNEVKQEKSSADNSNSNLLYKTKFNVKSSNKDEKKEDKNMKEDQEEKEMKSKKTKTEAKSDQGKSKLDENKEASKKNELAEIDRDLFSFVANMHSNISEDKHSSKSTGLLN